MRESRPAPRPASTGILSSAGVYERAEACLEAGLDRHFKPSGRACESHGDSDSDSDSESESNRARATGGGRERGRASEREGQIDRRIDS